jgi:phosphoheptose isomerase
MSESADFETAAGTVAGPIAAAIRLMVESLRLGGKIMACGNGGSAAETPSTSPQSFSTAHSAHPGGASCAPALSV